MVPAKPATFPGPYRPPPALAYAVAVAGVLAATWVRHLLDPILVNQYPYVTFFAALIFVSWFGGLGPGLVAFVGGAFAGAYFFLPPRYHLILSSSEEPYSPAIYGLFGIIILLFMQSLRLARARTEEVLRQTHQELEERVRERTAVLEATNRSLRREMDERERAEEKFRILFTYSSDAHLLLDEKEGIIDCNHAAVAMLRCSSKEEVLALHPAVLSPERQPDGRPSLEKAVEMDETARRKGFHRFDWLHRRKDGEVFPCEVTLTPVPLAGKSVLLVVWHDLTERKRAEEELRVARAQLMDAVESLDSALVMYGPDDRLAVCNNRYKELYFPAASHMVPGTLYPEILWAYCQAVARESAGLSPEALWAQRMASHRDPGHPMEMRVGNRWIRISDRRTSSGGVVSLSTDITEFRQAQEAAESASRAKGEFLANMSHEIRTPMNGILGMTTLLLDSGPSAEQREYLALIQSCTQSLLTVINDILDFSKIEAGRLDLDPIEFDLRQTLVDTLRTLDFRAREKGLKFGLRVDPEVPNRLVGDPDRLRQILYNLVGNALKFTARGEVAVRVEREGEPIDPATLRFSVTDTGIGIPAEKLESIFQPFVQVDGSTTRQFGGTGLGLSISARLVNLMGGRLEAQSRLGKGSTFSFTAVFPLGKVPVPEDVAPNSRPARPPGPGRALRILLAEDNAVNRMFAVRLLEKQGHTVVVADNGVEAIRVAETSPLDLVLMDVEMPDMDGFEATAALRKREEQTGGHLPVIAMTAHAMKGDRERCLAAGMDGYLTKPIHVAELLQEMEKVLTALVGENAPVAVVGREA